MTTAKTPKSLRHFEFPDPPEREPDDMTSFDHLVPTGNVHHLIQHLGNRETTLVAGEHYLSLALTRDLTGLRYPDLLVAFDVAPAAYKARNAYVIAEQGKPPDFVLEIASRSSGRIDRIDKRRDYAALGIPEYWRFDETGEYHRARLAGDRLAEGGYEPIPIEELADGVLQGYSAALNLNLRWENGQLGWHDPATGRHIATFESERNRADTAAARAESERAARIQAAARAESERAARVQAAARAESERAARIQAAARAEASEARAESAEARAAQLEAELRRLRGS